MSDDIAQNAIEMHALDNQVPPTPEGSELAEVQSLIAANARRLQLLAQTHRVGIPHHEMGRIQFSALVEYLYGGEGDPRRLAFERFLAGCIGKIIDGVEANANRATLLAGVNGAPLQLPDDRPRGKRRER